MLCKGGTLSESVSSFNVTDYVGTISIFSYFGPSVVLTMGYSLLSIAAIALLKRIGSQDGAKNEEEEMNYGIHKLLGLENTDSR